MIHPLVSDLFSDCPFLPGHLEEANFDLPTVVFGGVGRLIVNGRLSAEQVDSVFQCINALAEGGDAETLEVIGTGTIEMFNDTAEAQRLAREKLRGRALEMLEDFRRSWRQPDYSSFNDRS